jgi:hypothetical protein
VRRLDDVRAANNSTSPEVRRQHYLWIGRVRHRHGVPGPIRDHILPDRIHVERVVLVPSMKAPRRLRR